LIFNVKYDACVDISIFLMFVFIILISQAYLRGKSIDCGCFLNEVSAEDAEAKRWDMIKRIFEDIVFIILLITLKLRPSSKRDQ